MIGWSLVGWLWKRCVVVVVFEAQQGEVAVSVTQVLEVDVSGLFVSGGEVWRESEVWWQAAWGLEETKLLSS